jgi:hypothetical protein
MTHTDDTTNPETETCNATEGTMHDDTMHDDDTTASPLDDAAAAIMAELTARAAREEAREARNIARQDDRARRVRARAMRRNGGAAWGVQALLHDMGDDAAARHEGEVRGWLATHGAAFEARAVQDAMAANPEQRPALLSAARRVRALTEAASTGSVRDAVAAAVALGDEQYRASYYHRADDRED